jgi:NAD(P)-dependent dehydrogenase (short-subunit alcohol dehydrogenase family)
MESSTARNVLVTGAAGDIGHAIAAAFLKRGATVVASDSRQAALMERVAALTSLGKVFGIAAELSEPSAVAALAAETLRRAGRVDVLVNNAAFQPDGDVSDCDPESFDLTYQVNVRAPFLLSRALVPSMREAGGGAIVNLTSVHATAPGPRRLAYATSKTALLGMTRSMAVDLGRYNIRVNALSPGATLTTQLKDAWAQRQAESGTVDVFRHARRLHPLGRLAEVDDVAGAAVYLAEAGFVSGVELRVDGGFLSSLRLLPQADP